MIQEAEKLGITADQLTDMIRRGEKIMMKKVIEVKQLINRMAI